MHAYTYDDNGNRITNNGVGYAYDAENRLLSLSSGEQFQYDFAGRRVQKVEGRVTTYYFNEYYEVEETAPEPVGPFSYLLWTSTDGAAAPDEPPPPPPVAPAADGPTSVATRSYYVNGMRVAQNRGGVWTWINSAHLHSATVMTNSAGQEVRRLAYTAFGEEALNTGTGETPPYTYTGKELDSTGLMYYGARYYDPVLCRFITPDTVYDSGTQGLNRYSYALNNPILYNDPTGNFINGPDDENNPACYGCVTGSQSQLADDTASVHSGRGFSLPLSEFDARVSAPLTLGGPIHRGQYLGDGMWGTNPVRDYSGEYAQPAERAFQRWLDSTPLERVGTSHLRHVFGSPEHNEYILGTGSEVEFLRHLSYLEAMGEHVDNYSQTELDRIYIEARNNEQAMTIGLSLGMSIGAALSRTRWGSEHGRNNPRQGANQKCGNKTGNDRKYGILGN